jgi:carbamoyl-phosphate synthase large subunit
MPRHTDLRKILLIGSGPIVIGQGPEFDYSGVQACKALKEEGFEVVLVNSNPATIMTDPEFADRTYIEPITPEVVEAIMEREKPDAILPTMGGQTALNVAMELNRNGALARHHVRLIGANAQAIAKGEDRQLFKEAMLRIGLDVPRSGIAHDVTDASRIADVIGTFPLIIRPAFTLGGSGGGIAYNRQELDEIVARGLHLSPVSEVLIEESLLGWKEFEMEVMRDCADNCVVVCSIENLDPMGVHTGDSITVAPTQTLSDREYQLMRDASFLVIREIGVETGGSNIQFAVNPENGRMCVIEMNPRVSRSSALASKATGFPIAKIAAKLAVGYTLGRNPQRHHARDSGELRADDRLLRRKDAALHLREIPAGRPGADDADEERRRSDGDRAHVQGSAAESFALALRSSASVSSATAPISRSTSTRCA